MEGREATRSGVGSKTGADTQEYGRLKPNAVGLFEVIFMAVATAAPITAMTGNVPVAVGFGNGTGAPAGYLFATVVLTIFAVGYVTMARYITAAGAFYGYISHGLGQVVGMATVVVLLLLNSATAAGDASETLLFKLIPWIIIGVFVAGVGLALYLRAKSPERYRMIGRIVYEDTTERSETMMREE